MSELLDRLVRPEIRALTAYSVPDATGLIKLDAMENPYTWPDGMRQAWLDQLATLEVNRYPDPRGLALQEVLRATMGIPEDMALLLGNGSDELIQMLVLALAGEGRRVLSVEPGFVMYRLIARCAGMRYCGIPLQAADFALDREAVLAALARERPVLTFLAYPNNPTGNLFERSVLEEILAAAPGLVVLDEAYAPFTEATFMDRLGEWPNLLVLRTLSKMGLAGLRLGLLAGPHAWIDEIDKTRLPYNINVLSQASAAFALRHKAVFDAQTREIRSERARLFAALSARTDLRPYPSEANFLLLRLAPGRAGAVFASLKAQGILVKNLDGAHPQLADCLRVTVGRPEENAAFLEALSRAG